MHRLLAECLALTLLVACTRLAAAAPANDSFADRQTLRGLILTTVGDNIDATREFGEPDHWPGTGNRSAWWTWIAPADGPVSITTSNSTFDTLLAVYTGSALSNLTLVANNDDAPGIGPRSAVQFTATAGTAYHIAVDGFGRPNSASGAIQLNIAGTPPATPVLPPLVSLTQPAPDAFVRIGNVSLAAEAYDNDGRIVRVDFHRDGAPLGQDVLHPYQLVWTNATVGNYNLQAVATDDSGMSTTSAVVRVSVVLNPPPLVTLTSPTNNQTFAVPLNLPLAATAEDTDGISLVEFYAGDLRLGEATAAPYGLTWNNVVAGTYPLRAVATDALGLAATSAVVNITVTGNYPPTVSLLTPPNHAAFAAPASIPLEANAADLDGTIAKVEFYQGTAKLAEVAAAPFNALWNNVNTGQYVLTAIATDNGGLTATSTPISVTVTQQVYTVTNVLIAPGSIWSYLDDGTDQGTLWSGLPFDDSTWNSGPAQLGYGDGDEATVVSYGPNANNKYVTTYFRHSFVVTNADSYTNLSLELLRDDGAVAYLNGTEVWRANMPAGPIGYLTYAAGVAPEPSVDSTSLDHMLLVEGTNVFAVEMHQVNASSSDISFDMLLTGISDLYISNGLPSIVLTNPVDGIELAVPAQLVLEADAQDDFGIARVEFYNGPTLLGETTTAPYRFTLTNAIAGAYSLHAVAVDIFGLTATSTVVNATVTGDYAPFVALAQPADGASFVAPANLILQADAIDIDGTVARVEFYQGTTWLGETNNVPYRIAWNSVPVGNYPLTAVATDTLGNARTSAVVNIAVALNTPPTVSLDAPTPNEAFVNTDTIVLRATASDADDGLSTVEFFQGATRLGVALSSPYQFTWSNIATGTYFLRAVATDLGGLQSTSALVRIVVVDPANAFGGLGFDGVDDYVTFGIAPALSLARFTVETWFKWRGTGTIANTGGGGVRALPLVAKGYGESDGNNRDMNYFLGIDPATQTLVADLEEGAVPPPGSPGRNQPVYGVTPILPNLWHHAAVTYNGTNWQLFLNGNLEADLYVGQLPRYDSIQHASLAAALNSSGAPSGAFGGVLDEVRVWDYARTPLQIASNRTAQIEAETGLVGRWSLDETSGATAFDSTVGATHGTLVNGPLWTLGYSFASPPSIEITSPLPDTVLFAPITVEINAEAVDADGTIDLVEFYADALKLGETSAHPYAQAWTPAAPGYVTLTAAAIDNAGLATTSAPVVVLVENSIVQLTSPAHNARFVDPDPVPLAAAVSDTNGTIARVAFYANDLLVAEADTRPFTTAWTGASLGEHTLLAVAITAGGLQSTSAPKQILVVSNIPPTVAINSPTNSAWFYYPADVTLSATAADLDGAITNVQFFANHLLFASLATGPYRAVWPNPDLGTYDLLAVATDNRGLSTTSAPVRVVIQTNTPPAVVITRPLNGRGYIAPATVNLEAQATDLDAIARIEYYAGPDPLGQATNPPYPFVWANVPIGEYQLRAVATDAFGLAGTSAPVSISVTNNDPPAITLVNPTNGAVYTDLDTINLTALATDSDGIISVEFFNGDGSLGDDTISPYSIAWNRPPSGGHVLTAIATDGVGLRSTSAPVSISIIGSVASTNTVIPFNSVWKFLDNGSDQGAAWRDPAHDDATWNAGPAELGYGDGDEATIVSYGPSAANKYITTYFRHAFILDDASAYDFLYLQLKYDDGAVVYLNGTEIFRANLPSGPIDYLTETINTAENLVVSGAASPTLLRTGTNLIAVEVHQERASSSDLSFDFELQAVFNNVLPTVFLTSPANGQDFAAPTDIPMTASAVDSDGSIARVEFFVDGAKLGETDTAPYAFVWSNLTFGGEFELTALATDDNGGTSLSPAVTINVAGNRLPTAAITSPRNGAAFLAPTTIPIAVQAVDPDGSVTNVAFYANDLLVGNDTSSPFSLNWANAPAGDYVLTARAADNLGFSVTSAPVRISLLDVPPPQDLILWNSVWRYLDNGSDQGTAWQNLAFDDSTWASGPAELGYEDGDEATVVSYGPNYNNKYITTYFRQSFVLTDPSAYKSLFLRTLFDDGVVVYLNGTEIFRGNMPGGNILSSTRANTGLGDNTIMQVSVTPDALRSGTNVVAAEVHQDSPSSSDISFNLELIGSTTNASPTVAITSPADQTVLIEPATFTISASASDPDGNVTNVLFFQGDLLLGEDNSAPYTFFWPNVTADRYELTAVALDNFGDAATSSVVTAFVVVSTAPTVESFNPPQGPVSRLTQLTVNFAEPVTGVDAADLLVNGIPAARVEGSSTAYTFYFPQPTEGRVQITWAEGHGIVDREDPPKPFSGHAAGDTVTYQLTDTVPPTIVAISPPPGATLTALDRIRVTFSEPVGGLQDRDLLLITGATTNPAVRLRGSLTGPYDFDLPALPAAPGSLQVTWSPNHGIHDFALAQNPFAGSNWTYVLTPDLPETGVVINELMYAPASGQPAEEFLELFNTTATAISLRSWEITGGVDFVFPNVTLPPQGYLVVAANLAVFNAKYPGITNAVGNYSGRLANSDDRIRLRNPLGDVVNEVHYADRGDWATRAPSLTFPSGWDWFTDADGGGKTLELINPLLPNDNGQNWTNSAPAEGTPGRVNSVLAANIAPLIYDVEHFPVLPTASEAVTVTARVIDEAPSGVTVTLSYRNATSTSLPAFTTVTLFDDGTHGDGNAGDRVYGALVPAHAANTVIEFYVTATDSSGNSRSWPAPARLNANNYSQEVNAHYLVDDQSYSRAFPLLRLVMTGREWSEWQNTSRQSDAQMNATLIISDGTDVDVRHNLGVRYRGQGTRGRNPPNMRINIPSDRRWNGQDAFNLNGQFIHAQVAGNIMSLRSGVPASSAQIVEVRVNGVNYAPSGIPSRGSSSGGGFGAYILLEAQNGDWAANHFPDDGNGNVYRGVPPGGGWSAQLDWRGTDPASYYNSYSKTSNQGENDWTDIVNLSYALSSGLPDPQYLQEVRNNINVEAWMRYFAFASVVASGENGLPTGVGDDYALYRGILDPRFLLVFHDLDTSFFEGDGDYARIGVSGSIWYAVTRGGLPWADRFMRHNEFAPIYLRELHRLATTVFAAPQFNPLLEQILGGWVPQDVIARMQTFIAQRTANVLSQIPTNYTVNINLIQNSGYYYTTAPTLPLSGSGNTLVTRAIHVNGIPANWTAWNGTWSAPSVPLAPGINRLVVEWLDEHGAALRSQTVDVWRDDSSVATLPSVISADTNLTAVAGPYQVSGTVTVPAGVTLTLEPGTTLYFAQGARFIIEGTLLAEGTPHQRIRMTRQPGSNATWSGINFNETLTDNRIAYVDMEFASSGDPITVDHSRLLVDNVTWTGTTRTIIDMNTSSVIIRNSVFPTIVNSETVHGTGMPADGYVIIEGNYFGGTTGYSDIIDFTGGQRPGPIIQILNNVFNGGSDDALDLDATDAHIEGNTFMHIHQDASRDSGSYAIATDANTEVVVVRNLFYDNDHALLLKNGASAVFDHNTVVHIRTNSSAAVPASVIAFGEPQRPGVTGGAGATLNGNIFWDIDRNRHFLFYTNETMFLSVNHSILTGPLPPGVTGDGNLQLNPQFVNLTNDFRLLPTSPAIGTGPNGLDMGAYVPGGPSITGVPRSPTPQTAATLTIGGPGLVAYQYRLNDGPYSADTAITNPIVLTGLSNGVYTVYVVGQNSAGVWQDLAQPTPSTTWAVNTSATGLWINELLARNNRAVPVESGSGGVRYPDLVELYNSGSETIDLKDLTLTDDPQDPRRFTFPAGTLLGPDKYLVLYADNNDSPPGLHLGFGLNQDGDELYLFSPQGQLLDSVSFGLQVADRSIGRLNGGTWGLTTPTFGQPNNPADLATPDALLINEWLAAGTGAFAEDFIELYNPNTLPVDLSGAYLTDNPVTLHNLHAIAPLSYIAPRGYALFIADGNRSAGPNHVNFALAAELGFIGLFDPDLNPIDIVYYGPQTNNIALGRSPNGSTNISALLPPTPGSPNPAPDPGTGTHLVLNEVLAKNIDGSVTNLFGPDIPNATPEWIEIYNPTPNPIDLEEFSVSDDLAQPRRYVFGAATIPAGGHYAIMCNGSAPPSEINTGFGIKANGDTVYLFDKPGAGGSLLDSISYGVQARDFSIGRSPDGSTNWVLTVPSPAGANIAVNPLGNPMDLRLNEWLADPLPGDDDWFEIYNPSPQPVELSGLFLTDDISTPAGRTKFAIAPLSFIGTRFYGYERFIADDNVAAGPDHTNFKLSGSGESLGLHLDANTPIDTLTFGRQTEGVSEGRLPDGTNQFVRFPNSATPGDANFLPLTNIVISEVLSHSSSAALEDAIELHNPTTNAIDISGWFLSDKERDLIKFPIPTPTVIPPGGFVAFYEYQFFADPDSSESFALDSAKGDQVHLSAATNGLLTGYRTSVSFDAAAPDVSFGSYTNQAGTALFVAMSQRTFGMDNPETVAEFRTGTGAANPAPRVGPIVITEIMYHPPDIDGVNNTRDEFIELYNITAAPVPLWDLDFPTNTWRLRDAVRFDFPETTFILPGDYLLVVSFDPVNDTNSLAAFRAQYNLDASVPVFGPFTGSLDNAGESVELYMPDHPEPSGDPDAGYVPYILVERVKYSDDPPWDPAADGDGFSLQRIDPTEFGNDPYNWEAASPTPGPSGLLDTDRDGMPNYWENRYGLDRNVDDALLDLDGDGMSNLDEFHAGTLPNDSQSSLAVQIDHANPRHLSFTAMAQRGYIVEFSDTLNPGTWTTLNTVPPQPHNRTELVIDPTPASTRFYRIRLNP